MEVRNGWGLWVCGGEWKGIVRRRRRIGGGGGGGGEELCGGTSVKRSCRVLSGVVGGGGMSAPIDKEQ